MKMLLPLAAMAAVAASTAHAQDAQVYYASDTWPVSASGRTCTLSQAAPDGGSALSVAFDGSEVVLTTTNPIESALPESGSVALTVVFLDNGNGDIAYDDGWGSRQFAYTRGDGVYRFSTRFSGERNVRQFLTDLASSRALGFTQRGQTVVGYELADVSASVARLRQCAARAVAAN